MVRWRICRSPAFWVVFLCVIVSSFFYQPASYAATLTVCASGCNHATIQAAVNAASNDDVINITQAGTYASFDITLKNLTITGTGASTIVDGGGTDYPANIGDGNTLVTVTLQNLKFTNPGGFNPIIYINKATVTVQDCIIDNSGGTYYYGISIDSGSASTLTLKNSLITGYGTYGVLVQGGSTANISFSIFDGYIDANTKGSYAVRNNASTTTVNSAIVANNTAGCLLNQGVLPLTAKFTNCYNSGGSYYGTGNIALDPKFVGGGNYTLQADSPVINKGDPHFLDNDGSRSDMGYTGGKGDPSNILKVDGSGSSNYAFSTISNALAAALSGDTIRVAGGTYNEEISISNTSINLIFEGGYDSSWNRNVSSNETFISGLSASSHTGTITIDGFTVAGKTGQAIYTNSANTNININNCKLRNNTSSGIFLGNVGTASITNNTIYSNGYNGIHIQTHTQATITGNTVYSHTCGSSCIGMYLSSANNNDVISGNTLYSNYAGINVAAADPTSSFTISSNTVYSNTTHGIYIQNGNPMIKNNISRSNAGNGLYINTANNPTITNNVFANNTIYGIRFGDKSSAGNPIIKNNILYKNDRGIVFSAEGGYGSSDVYPSALKYNCFYANNYGSVMHASDNTNPAGYSYYSELPADFNDLNRPTWSDYNIIEDPGFVDAANHDYRLKATSFLIDQGDPDDSYANEPEDNGDRINIGAYGNTATAKTAQAAPAIANISGLQDGGNVIISLDTNTAKDRFWVKVEYWDGNAYQIISQSKLSGSDYTYGYKTDFGRVKSGAGKSITWNTNGALFNGNAFLGQIINSLKVRLTVEHNGQSASAESGEFSFDGTKPVITINAPGNNIYISTKQPDFYATATSSVGISNVKFQYKISVDETFTDLYTDNTADELSQYAAVWGGASLTSGQAYNMKAVVTNTLGSTSSSTVNITVCSYALSSSSKTFETNASNSDSVDLTVLNNSCYWGATTSADWITINCCGNTNGNGSINYSISENSGPARSGTVTIADQTFTVNQPSGCTYSINSNSSNAIAGGANGSISVTTNTGSCPWTAVSNAAWITVTSGSNGTGNAATGYSVAANTGPARSGTITIAGHTFTLNQAAGCAYTISPASSSPAAAGATANVTVTSSDGCAWTASSNAAWISITSGANGSGNGTTNYTVTANPNAGPRTGTLTIAGQTFTVTQSGSSCSYSLSATTKVFGLSGGSDSVNVTAMPSDCAWTATSNAAWLTISAGSSGTGNGTVTYSASANASSSSRSGAITIGGQTFTVTQAGVTCSQTLVPASKAFGVSGGSDSIALTSAASDCAWTAVSNETWITVSSGKNGTGNGTINYTITANTSVSARNGSISIGPQTFAITQTGASCTYTISPTGKALTSSGGSDSITVTPSVSDCTWTAAGNESWIAVTAGSSGTGNGTVSYTVSENTGSSLRNGTITIADKTYTITQDGVTVTSPQQFTLTVSAAGDGSGTVTSSLAGIDCGPDCSEAYNSGTSLVLTAVADSGSAFTGWANCANISGGTCTVTVTSDVAISASFAAVTENQYVLTIDKTGNGSGTVTSSDGEIECGSDCDETGAVYDTGNQVTLTATVGTGSTFGGWTGDACNGSKGLTCKVTMDSDKSISVSFKAHPIVTVLKSGNGDGTLTSSPKGINCGIGCTDQEYTFKKGQTILLKAKPDTGSRFIGWSGDVCNGSKTQTCKITKISDDREVTAQFGQPDMSVSDQAIAFDDTLKMQTASKTVTITNNGDAPLTLKSIKIISGTDLKSVPRMFKVYSGLNGKLITKTTIPAESDLDLIVKFRPTSTGQKTATLRITSDDTDNQLAEIQLSGTGITPPNLPLDKGRKGGGVKSQYPEGYVTREEAAAIIFKSLELGVRSQGPNSELSTLDSQLSCETGPFIDVSPDRWSCKYIKKLEELGLSGCDEARFCPEDYITREEMAEIIVKSLDAFVNSELSTPDSQLSCDGSPFADVSPDNPFCKYIKRLYELGMPTWCELGAIGPASSNNIYFCPQDLLTIGQAAEICMVISAMIHEGAIQDSNIDNLPKICLTFPESGMCSDEPISIEELNNLLERLMKTNDDK